MPDLIHRLEAVTAVFEKLPPAKDGGEARPGNDGSFWVSGQDVMNLRVGRNLREKINGNSCIP
jgi:hypothetical protein